MTINVEVTDATITDSGIALTIVTEKDGQRYQFGRTFPTSMTAAQIKDKIDSEVRLLWLAMNTNKWTV